LAYAEIGSNFALFPPAYPPDVFYALGAFRGDLRQPVSLPECVAPFAHAVMTVISIGAREQMRRIYALMVIACVTDMKSIWNLAMNSLIGESMSADNFVRRAAVQIAIAVAFAMTLPQMTAGIEIEYPIGIKVVLDAHGASAATASA
jgi:hypothetical protein